MTLIIRLINVLIAFFLLFVPNSAIATSSPPLKYSTTTAEHIIYATAAHYAISGDELRGTLWCESRFKPNAIGDRGTSYGVAQIHLPAHPDITKEQALDPIWSINWAAKEFAAGRAWQWTCWNDLYGGSAG